MHLTKVFELCFIYLGIRGHKQVEKVKNKTNLYSKKKNTLQKVMSRLDKMAEI